MSQTGAELCCHGDGSVGGLDGKVSVKREHLHCCVCVCVCVCEMTEHPADASPEAVSILNHLSVSLSILYIFSITTVYHIQIKILLQT